MFKILVTGGIGSGVSTILNIIYNNNVELLSLSVPAKTSSGLKQCTKLMEIHISPDKSILCQTKGIDTRSDIKLNVGDISKNGPYNAVLFCVSSRSHSKELSIMKDYISEVLSLKEVVMKKNCVIVLTRGDERNEVIIDDVKKHLISDIKYINTKFASRRKNDELDKKFLEMRIESLKILKDFLGSVKREKDDLSGTNQINLNS